MIKNMDAISLSETMEYLDKKNERDAKIIEFAKEFNTLKIEKAKELRKNLESLNLIKMNPLDIAKLIDILPEKPEEVNKIFTDVSLDEDETKKIIDTIKQFK